MTQVVDPIKTLRDQLAAKADQARALLADTSADALPKRETLFAEIKTLKSSLETAVALDAEVKDVQANLYRPMASGIAYPAGNDTNGNDFNFKRSALPARVRRMKTKNFKDDGQEILPEYRMSGVEKAYRAGMWFRAVLTGDAKAVRFCQDHGLELKAHSESVNSGGGVLVPEELDDTLIDLREQYGVFRKYAKNRPMIADTKRVARRTGGLTAYFITDNVIIPDSTKSWDSITLVAKKLAVLAYYSNELNEDAMIDIMDDLAYEIAWGLALKEDQCGFVGDGTSTYDGITGVCNKLKGLSGTYANIAGLQIGAAGTGANYTSFTLADFNAVVGLLPQYADDGNAAWFVHRTFWANTMQRLALAAGGVTAQEVLQGATNPVFLGYPVVISQVMPQFAATNQVVCLFGDLRKAASFGDRRETTIATSEHVGFAYDQMAIRGTERFDIVVHDVGNASGTASLKVPGPIVGLMTASS